MKYEYNFAAPVVLGMHDALVSLIGLIAGMTFAFADAQMIILTAIIASVTAGLSMGASCYLAERQNESPHATKACICTGGAYIITCILLIIPFFLIKNTYNALGLTFIIAVLIILLFNIFTTRLKKQSFSKHFWEMLIICATVSTIAFLIGNGAKYFFNISF